MRIGKDKTEKALIEKIKDKEAELGYYRRKITFIVSMETRMITEGIDRFFSQENYKFFMKEKDLIRNYLIPITTEKIKKLKEKYERLTGKKYEENTQSQPGNQ